MRILDVAIEHPDGRVTDEDGKPLSFYEQLFAKEFRTPDGKDSYDLAYEAGVRSRKRKDRRIMSVIVSSGDKSFGMADLVER